MSEWEDRRLGDCVQMLSGGTPSKANDDYWNGDIPWVSAKDLKSFFLHDAQDHITKEAAQNGTKIAPKSSIFILVRGMTLHNDLPIGCLTREMAFNQDVKAIIADENLIESKYFAYWLLANKPQLMGLVESASHGTGRINTDDLKSVIISCPELKEQKQISGLLGNFDRKISNLRQQNETLEKIAQTLFKHWFVDFEFPNEDGKPYKSSGGEMMRSELGEIPAGWCVGKFRDITAVINGRAYKQTEFREEGTPIVRIQNLTGKGQTVYSDLTLDKDKYISKGDLIYAWSATFGPYIWRGVKSIYHYHIWKLNCFNPAFKYYLYIHLKKVSDRVQGQGTGSIFTHITKELMESQELPIPEEKVMERWHGFAAPIFDKIMINHEQIKTLTKTRDVLLPKLMSGKLRISE